MNNKRKDVSLWAAVAAAETQNQACFANPEAYYTKRAIYSFSFGLSALRIIAFLLFF